jgi:lipopolysaccharide export system protein LptA
MIAIRHVFLVALAATISAATFHVAADAAAATSDLFKGFQSNSKDPIQVDAKTLEIAESEGQRISTFSGGVTVTRGDTVMRSATLKLYQDTNAPDAQKSQFSRMEAAGSVVVTQGPQTVTGNTAVFTSKTNTIVLSGDVVLTQGKNVITGDRLVVDLTSGVARVEQSEGKRIHGVFTPEEKPAAAAAPDQGKPQ